MSDYWHYMGWSISPRNRHGMYSAWKDGELRLAADDMAGMREIIRDKEQGR